MVDGGGAIPRAGWRCALVGKLRAFYYLSYEALMRPEQAEGAGGAPARSGRLALRHGGVNPGLPLLWNGALTQPRAAPSYGINCPPFTSIVCPMMYPDSCSEARNR